MIETIDEVSGQEQGTKLLFAMLFAVCFLVGLFVIFGVADKEDKP